MANCSTLPGVEVLRRAHTVSVKALITVSQLRWAGHVRQMANSRLPKAVFYSQLRQGKRSHEGQKLRFIEAAYEGNRHLAWYLGVGRSLESQMARTVEEGHFSQISARRNISVYMSDDTRQLPQAVSNATIVSVTADPERVWLPTREPV